MTLHRFFIDPQSLRLNRVTFPKEVSRQITKVLRLKKGYHVVVLDNTGMEYLVELEVMKSDAVSGKVISRTINENEPKINISLYQALLPREKFEVVLQKGTEIGISHFIPIETKYSLLKRSHINENKKDRWQRIVQEASEQCERGVVPEIEDTLTFEDAIEQAKEKGPVLLAYEREDKKSVSWVLDSLGEYKKISILIGPEGGFEKSEIEYAEKNGVILVSLGRRILRSETAGIVLSSVILYEKGEL